MDFVRQHPENLVNSFGRVIINNLARDELLFTNCLNLTLLFQGHFPFFILDVLTTSPHLMLSIKKHRRIKDMSTPTPYSIKLTISTNAEQTVSVDPGSDVRRSICLQLVN